MDTKPAKSTRYTSAVRDEAKQATRSRILDALVRVVLSDGIHSFSVATVAAAAGVSHRTVYRHFASREELLEGLAEDVDGSHAPGEPPGVWPGVSGATLDQPDALFERMFGGLTSIRDRASAEFILGVALRHSTRGKLARWEAIQHDIRERFPALSAEEHLEGAAALRVLISSNAWFHLCVMLGVDPGPAGRGIARAVQLLVNDLKERNDARAGVKPTEEER